MDIQTGQRLASLRRAKGLSQEELAASLGLSRQAISNWERGESAPDTDNLIALSRFYGVSLDELVSRSEITNGTATHDAGAEISNGAPSDKFPVTPVSQPARARSAFLALGLAVTLSYAYYLLVARSLAMTTMDDATAMFGLTPSPGLAVMWFALEVAVMLLPYLVLAFTARRMREIGRWIWLAPAIAYIVPLAALLSFKLASGTSVGYEYSGLHAALASSVMIKADVLGIVLGCALVWWAVQPSTRLTRAST